LEGVSAATASPVVQSAALHCPNCGGSIQLRGFAHTLTAVCEFCGAVIDTSTPLLRVLQTAQTWQRPGAAIPLGSRGKLDGIEWEIIGYQVRGTEAMGVTYEWREYVLFNPYRGFRYLSEYDGHWNFIQTLSRIPEGTVKDRNVHLDGRTFRKFQSARAETKSLLGEFPWRLQVGEQVDFVDYIAPPLLLSGEVSGKQNEITWSLGRYIKGAEIWKAFQASGAPPATYGVFENQPSPHGSAAGLWGVFGWSFLGVIAVMILLSARLHGNTIFEQQYSFDPSSTAEPSFVTQDFNLKPPTGNVEVQINTDIENNWMYLNIALIGADGHAYNIGREVSFYEGADSDGHWTEGSKSASATISPVPAGTYFLRVEPEGEKSKASPPVEYTLRVRRHVLSALQPLLAVLLLAIPPIYKTWRVAAFEQTRWRESDYATHNG
jgi:hypothetical protein